MGGFTESPSFSWDMFLFDCGLADSEFALEKYGEVVLSSAEPCLNLKKDEVSLL